MFVFVIELLFKSINQDIIMKFIQIDWWQINRIFLQRNYRRLCNKKKIWICVSRSIISWLWIQNIFRNKKKNEIIYMNHHFGCDLGFFFSLEFYIENFHSQIKSNNVKEILIIKFFCFEIGKKITLCKCRAFFPIISMKKN